MKGRKSRHGPTVKDNYALILYPYYSPRKDGKACLAEDDFKNEYGIGATPPLCAHFPPPDPSLPERKADWVGAGEKCDGAGVNLAMKLIRKPN